MVIEIIVPGGGLGLSGRMAISWLLVKAVPPVQLIVLKPPEPQEPLPTAPVTGEIKISNSPVKLFQQTVTWSTIWPREAACAKRAGGLKGAAVDARKLSGIPVTPPAIKRRATNRPTCCR